MHRQVRRRGRRRPGPDRADRRRCGSDGYLDIEANSPIAPAEVTVFTADEGRDSERAQQGIYGIDLGTTYSVVAYIDETGRPAVTRNSDGDDTTPSVVYFESADNIVVGKMAKESAGVCPDQVVSLIKREMGNKDYTRTFYGKEYTSPSHLRADPGRAGQGAPRRRPHRPVQRGGHHRAGLLRPAGEGRHQEGRRDRRPGGHRDRPRAGRGGPGTTGSPAARTAPRSWSMTWAAAPSTSP